MCKKWLRDQRESDQQQQKVECNGVDGKRENFTILILLTLILFNRYETEKDGIIRTSIFKFYSDPPVLSLNRRPFLTSTFLILTEIAKSGKSGNQAHLTSFRLWIHIGILTIKGRPPEVFNLNKHLHYYEIGRKHGCHENLLWFRNATVTNHSAFLLAVPQKCLWNNKHTTTTWVWYA